jgi:hypothetical protein
MQCPGLRAVLSRRRGGPPCTARGTRGCGHDGRRVPRRSPGGSPCYGGTTRPARHRRARAGSRLAPGRSTRRRRRCTCTTGTAPLGQPLPPRAPPLRRRDGFLAFLVGLGDGPRVGHVTPLRPEGPGSYLGPLHLCHAESTEPTRSPSTWTSTPPISADPDGRLHAGDDPGGDLAQDAVHRLSTGAHNLPVSPPRPPSSTGSGVAARPAAPRRYDGEVSVGEEI